MFCELESIWTASPRQRFLTPEGIPQSLSGAKDKLESGFSGG